jgi:hypothetical protein
MPSKVYPESSPKQFLVVKSSKQLSNTILNFIGRHRPAPDTDTTAAPAFLDAALRLIDGLIPPGHPYETITKFLGRLYLARAINRSGDHVRQEHNYKKNKVKTTIRPSSAMKTVFTTPSLYRILPR